MTYRWVAWLIVATLWCVPFLSLPARAAPFSQSFQIPGHVYYLTANGRTLWIGASFGLYEQTNVALSTPTPVPGIDGPVYDIKEENGTLWIAARNGVFWWRYQDENPKRILAETDQVFSLHRIGTNFFACTTNGLFRLNTARPETPAESPTNLLPNAGAVYRVVGDNSMVWAAAEHGLFLLRFERGAPRFELIDGRMGVRRLQLSGRTLWIGTTNSLYCIDNVGTFKTRLVTKETGQVETFLQTNNSLLIGAEKGVFMRIGASSNAVTRVFGAAGYVSALCVLGRDLYVGGGNGVFVSNSGDWRNFSLVQKIPNVVFLYPRGGVLLAGTHSGEFAIPLIDSTTVTQGPLETTQTITIPQNARAGTQNVNEATRLKPQKPKESGSTIDRPKRPWLKYMTIGGVTLLVIATTAYLRRRTRRAVLDPPHLTFGRKAHVFISHSRQDKRFVRTLVEELKKYRLNVWFDEHEIKVGESIVEKVSDALKNADYLVVVLSKASVVSRWVQAELDAVFMEELAGRGKVVLPVVIEDCDVPMLLRPRLYADFRQDFADGVKKLLVALEQETQSSHAQAVAPLYSTRSSSSNCDATLAALSQADLRRRITTRMDRNELAVVWHDLLGAEMDNDLGTQPLSICAIKLLNHAKNRNALPKLIQIICKERPDLAQSD